MGEHCPVEKNKSCAPAEMGRCAGSLWGKYQTAPVKRMSDFELCARKIDLTRKKRKELKKINIKIRLTITPALTPDIGKISDTITAKRQEIA